MAFCNNCGSQLPDGAKVCPACGRPISEAAKKAAGMKTASASAAASKKKKKSNAPVIALFAACGVAIAAIIIVLIIGFSSNSDAVVGTTDDAEAATLARRTVDLSVVEEEIGDYDEVDTVTFTDKNGDTYTADSVKEGVATADLPAGDYTYKVTTEKGQEYSGTVTVPAIKDETKTSSGKTETESKSAVTVDPTPIVVQPETSAQTEQTPEKSSSSDKNSTDTQKAEDKSSSGTDTQPAESKNSTGTDTQPAESKDSTGTDAQPAESKNSTGTDTQPAESKDSTDTGANEELPSEDEPKIDSEPAAVSGDDSAEDEAGDENVTVPAFIHFSVKDRESDTLGQGDNICTYDAQYAELSASSAADFPALASALKQDAEDLFASDAAAINDVIGDGTELSLGAGMTSYWERTVSVVRADSTIFSVCWSVNYYFAGAAHGYAYSETTSYDPQTGEKLSLSDVVKDTDKLVSILEEQADEYYGDDIMTTVTDFVAANGLDSLAWTMDYTGLTVYFDSYDLSMYAAGPFGADVTFSNHSDLFDAKWTAAPDDYAVLLCSGTDSSGASFDINGDGTAESYDFYTLITEILPEFFGSYDEKYVHDDNLMNAAYDGEIELTGVYGVKVGGNSYLCVFAMIPDVDGVAQPAFGTFKADGSGYAFEGIYIGDPVTLDEQITDPSVFYVTDAEGGSVPAYISADGELCLN